VRFPSLDAWLTWQEGLHPKPVDLGLDRVAGVWSRLRPEGLPFPAIVVGGTNGKGSCVAMLEAMLLASGYRVGCYTSPHLDRYHERVRIGGLAVEDVALCEAFERVDRVRGGVSLTYFEFGTLAALEIFSATPLDLVVLEVGLGGRLDAVNIVDADVAVVTTIGLDHTEWLGSTLEQIAEEKAGVFRRGRPAVIGRAIPHLRSNAARSPTRWSGSSGGVRRPAGGPGGDRRGGGRRCPCQRCADAIRSTTRRWRSWHWSAWGPSSPSRRAQSEPGSKRFGFRVGFR